MQKTTKTCPICKVEKPLDDFDKYFSKERNKYRPQNYCKSCHGKEANRRAKVYYETNREERLEYHRQYRRDPQHKEKRRKWGQDFKIKARGELRPCYVADQIATKWGVQVKYVYQVPGLIEAYTAKIQLHRTLKSFKHAKK